ncbi:CBS domain-containing protein [Rhodococcus sp. NPDC058521]|uniref:CBS domain-containing protein n=1 Tax=Rhodococcus sp. NPDC058521 TaxID=3346536 RepID=UPI003652634A
MRIAEVLRNKGSSVTTVSPETSVEDLLEELTRRNIGALIVVDHDAVIGMVSERDVVRRIQKRGAAVLQERVCDIMTTEVFTCLPTDSVDSLAETMTEHRIRHLPVMVDRSLVGIVSIGDVVKSRMDELRHERDQLESYIDQAR